MALAERVAGVEALMIGTEQPDVVAALHSLRGAAAMLEQDRLADALHRLEIAVHAGENVDLAEIVAEWAQLTVMINHWDQRGDNPRP